MLLSGMGKMEMEMEMRMRMIGGYKEGT